MKLHNGLDLFLAALLGSVAASDANADGWAAYTSANFTVYSDAREPDVLDLLRDFEEYRRVALVVMNLPDQPEHQALKIVYPTRAADFRALGARANLAGFFYHAEYGPRIVIRGATSRRGGSGANAANVDRQTLYHEYVHYLMDQRSGLNYPPWYREGLAQVLMMVNPSEAMIQVGLPLRRGIDWGSLDATVRDIVDTDYRGGVAEFYLLSWLLTHYLTVDAYDKPQRRQQAADYLRRYDAGEDPLDAFKASFGVTAAALQPTLEAYGRQRTLRVLQVPRSPYDGEVSVRPLTDGEDLYLLGDLAAERYASAAALEFFDEFVRRYEDSPLRVKVLSRRAVALAHQDDLAAGDAVVDEILALGPEDGDVLADLAHYFHDWFQIRYDEAPAEARATLERSIRYGERAVEINPQDLEALFYLGRAYGFNGDPNRAADVLLRAFEQAPGVDNINLALARVLYQAGDKADAILLISRVYSGSHSEEARERYSTLLREMREGNVAKEFLDPYPFAD